MAPLSRGSGALGAGFRALRLCSVLGRPPQPGRDDLGLRGRTRAPLRCPQLGAVSPQEPESRVTLPLNVVATHQPGIEARGVQKATLTQRSPHSTADSRRRCTSRSGAARACGTKGRARSGPMHQSWQSPGSSKSGVPFGRGHVTSLGRGKHLRPMHSCPLARIVKWAWVPVQQRRPDRRARRRPSRPLAAASTSRPNGWPSLDTVRVGSGGDARPLLNAESTVRGRIPKDSAMVSGEWPSLKA